MTPVVLRPLLPLLAGCAAVLAGGASAEAAQVPTASRIINGSATTNGEFPAQVHVRFEPGYVCGGTLVSGNYVLSAAHCATDDNGDPVAPEDFTLRLGSRFSGSGGFIRDVSAVERHGAYDDANTPVNDVALLRLSVPAPDTLEPLRLIGTGAAENALWAAGTTATVIGWGDTIASPQTSQLSPSLLKADVPIVGDPSCTSIWGSSMFKTASMVCAGGGGTDSCGGDSDGPLMVQRNGARVLVGVVSWGASACATLGVPGVYARMGAPALNTWLRDRIPTVDFTAPAAPAGGEAFALSAVADHPDSLTPTAFAWDLDGDGAYDDATGASTTATLAAGTRTIGVQTTYADGDRATDRDQLVVSGTPQGGAEDPPPTPDPPPTTPAPAPAPAPAPSLPATVPFPQFPVTPVATPRPTAPVSTVSAPTRSIKLLRLREGRLAFRFSCTARCTVSARLMLTKATRKKLGVRSTTLGTASRKRSSAGDGRLVVKLRSDAKKRLRTAKGTFTATLKVRLTVDGKVTTRDTRIRVRR